MSHAYGQVKFEDGTIMHYEYNGTVDLVCNCLYQTREEVTQNWRNQPSNQCICGKDEFVKIGTDYGSGYWWPGCACKYCKAITMGFGSGGNEVELFEMEQEGLPSWWLKGENLNPGGYQVTGNTRRYEVREI